jgi:hypothetical protein
LVLILPNAAIVSESDEIEIPMKIVVRPFWDDEAKVWCGIAQGHLGSATEAPTLHDLCRKLPVLVQDLLEDESQG